jgi:hypothetical protein
MTVGGVAIEWLSQVASSEHGHQLLHQRDKLAMDSTTPDEHDGHTMCHRQLHRFQIPQATSHEQVPVRYLQLSSLGRHASYLKVTIMQNGKIQRGTFAVCSLFRQPIA